MDNPFGSFTQEALEAYQKAVAEKEGVEFSERETYDFTTCIRPDGSAYGTRGKCRKGTEGEAKTKEKKPRSIYKPEAEEKIAKANKAYKDALEREFAAIRSNDRPAIAKAKAETKEAFGAYKKERDAGLSDWMKDSLREEREDRRKIKEEDDKAAAEVRAKIARERAAAA
jgi:hypothetical protein